MSYETIYVLMPKELRKYSNLELLNILNSEFLSISIPVDNFGILIILKIEWSSTFKISKVFCTKFATAFYGVYAFIF